jgi:hypothetical protein
MSAVAGRPLVRLAPWLGRLCTSLRVLHVAPVCEWRHGDWRLGVDYVV